MADTEKELRIPPRGKRGSALSPAWFFRLVGPLMRTQISRYRKTTSSEAPRMMGFPTVLLTTTGARTGHEHTNILGGFADEQGRWVIVASKGGAATHPHWFINLAKHPDQVWLEVGNRRMKVRPELLQGAEREEALARVASVAPRYGEYQKKTDREIPVIRLEQIAA